MTTMREIARQANVSPGLVSRIIKKDPTLRVSVETRSRVESIVKANHYHLPASSRYPVSLLLALRKERVQSDPYFSSLLKQLKQQMKNFNMEIAGTYYLPDKELISQLPPQQGLLAVAPFTGSALTEMKKISSHLVVIDDNTFQPGLNIIRSNFDEVTKQLLNNFVALGRRSIAFAGGNIPRINAAGKEWENLVDRRLASYYKWTKYHSLELRILNEELNIAGGRRAANQLIEQQRDGHAFPNAVIAINDLVARGMIDELVAHGIRIPEDICVAGFDNLLIATVKEPQITSVQLPVAEIANAAIRLMNGLITNQVLGTNIVIVPAQIRYRTSCPLAD